MYRCNSSVCVIYTFVFTGVSTTRQECMFRDLPTRGNSTHTARQSRIIASRPGTTPRPRYRTHKGVRLSCPTALSLRPQRLWPVLTRPSPTLKPGRTSSVPRPS